MHKNLKNRKFMTTTEGVRYLRQMAFKGYDLSRILQQWAEYKSHVEVLDILYKEKEGFNRVEWSELCNHFSALKYTRMRSIVGMLHNRYQTETVHQAFLQCDKLFGKGNWEAVSRQV